MLLFKRSIWKVLRLLKLSAPLILMRSSALISEGWFKSFYSEESIDSAGNAIPWYTYPTIHFLEQRIDPSFRVFEYGSGNSTLWYARKAQSVIAVEHDPEWSAKVATKLPSSAQVIYKDLNDANDAYVKEILNHGLFDIVVIDGRRRSECALAALEALKKEGVLIWDNSERKRYEKGIKQILSQGFHQIAFKGMAPIVPYISETSIFYKRAYNCLGI